MKFNTIQTKMNYRNTGEKEGKKTRQKEILNSEN